MTASKSDVQAKLDAATADLNASPPDIPDALFEIAAAREEVDDLIDPAAPPPSTFWAWDAQALKVDPGSAAFIKSLLASTPHGWVGASSPVAIRSVAKSTDYQGHGSAWNGLDATFMVPAGVKAGLTTDHHLVIRDELTGRTHDMWVAKFDANGRFVSAKGGRSYDTNPVVAYMPKMVKAGANTSTNAGNVPTEPANLVPADVARGVADHTLRFVFHLPGPGAVRYPAAPYLKPYGGLPATNPPVGAFIRLRESAVLPAKALALERCIFNTLKQHGAVGTDGGSDLTFKARDLNGGGQGAAEWAAVGVTLIQTGGAASGLKCGATYQMTLIPWSELEVVVLPVGA